MALSGTVMAIRWLKGSGACGVGKVTVLAPSNRDSDQMSTINRPLLWLPDIFTLVSMFIVFLRKRSGEAE